MPWQDVAMTGCVRNWSTNWNRVFDHVHKQEIKKVKEDGTWTSSQLETLVHPNEYFKRSYMLKNLNNHEKADPAQSGDVKMEG